MGLTIEDGKGSGQLAQVEANRLRGTATSCSLSNHVTLDITDGGVYTAIGTATITAAGTYYPLFIQNTDPSFQLVFDRILVEVVGTTGATSIPNAGDYFSLLLNTTSSGGTVVTPVNLNRTSTKVANVIATDVNPAVVATSAVESHRWYPTGNGVAFELIRPETDDIILGRNTALTIRYITATVGGTGTILVTAKFLMVASDSMG